MASFEVDSSIVATFKQGMGKDATNAGLLVVLANEAVYFLADWEDVGESPAAEGAKTVEAKGDHNTEMPITVAHYAHGVPA